MGKRTAERGLIYLGELKILQVLAYWPYSLHIGISLASLEGVFGNFVRASELVSIDELIDATSNDFFPMSSPSKKNLALGLGRA